MSNQVLQFVKSGIWDQDAVRMRIPHDQKRNPALRVSFVEENGLPLRGTEQVAGLEAQTKRRPGDFCSKEVALREPRHIARENLLRRHAPVRIPRVFSHQMAGQNFVSHRLENLRGSSSPPPRMSDPLP